MAAQRAPSATTAAAAAVVEAAAIAANASRPSTSKSQAAPRPPASSRPTSSKRSVGASSSRPASSKPTADSAPATEGAVVATTHKAMEVESEASPPTLENPGVADVAAETAPIVDEHTSTGTAEVGSWGGPRVGEGIDRKVYYIMKNSITLSNIFLVVSLVCKFMYSFKESFFKSGFDWIA